MGKRNSNIEALRILAMIFITAHHLALWGYFYNFTAQDLQSNTIWLQFLELWGKIGVDLFMLITGYFALNPKPTVTKVLQLTNKIRFYTVGLLIILVMGGMVHPGIKLIFGAFFPTLRFVYCFISIYVIIYIFSGHLSKYFKQLSQRSAIKFIILNIFIFMVLPTFCFSQGNTLTDLITVFFVGLYLRRFGISIKFIRFLKFATGITVIMIFGTIIASDLAGVYFGKPHLISNAPRFIINGSSPLALILAIAIFVLALSLQPKNNQLINWLSSSALAIYLIQENNLFRLILWKNIAHVSEFAKSMNSPQFIIYTLVVILGIVVSGLLIDKLMIFIFKKPAKIFFKIEMLIVNSCIDRIKHSDLFMKKWILIKNSK